MPDYFVERWKSESDGELLFKSDNFHDANEFFNAYKDLIKTGEVMELTIEDFVIKIFEHEVE